MIMVPALEAFAESEPIVEENQAEIMEDISGIDEIVEDFYSTDDNLIVADGQDSIVSIPEDGGEQIILDDGLDNTLGISLPEMVKDEEGILSDNGTVVYNDEESKEIWN